MASFSRWLSTRKTVSSGYRDEAVQWDPSGLVATGGVCIEGRGSDTHTDDHIFRFLVG